MLVTIEVYIFNSSFYRSSLCIYWRLLYFRILKENEYRECKDILLITDEDEVSINKDDVFIEYDTSGKG